MFDYVHLVLGSNLSDERRSDTEDLVRDDDASSSSYNDHEAHINPCLLISPSCSENEEVEENHDDCEEKNEIKFQVSNYNYTKLFII